MKIRVQVLNENGGVKKAREVIETKNFNAKTHRHLSGRDFSKDEVKGFGSKAKVEEPKANNK